MTFELSAPKRLGRIVVLGYCDIAAAGIRVLEGISGRPASTADGTSLELREMGRETLTFTGMGAAVFDGFPALEAVHLDEVAEVSEGDRSDEPAVTMLKLNTAVGQDLSASLVLSLVDLLAVHRPTLDRLIIVAAVQPPKRHQMPAAAATIPPDVVCTFSCDGHRGGNDGKHTKPLPASVSKLSALPTGARLADSFLTTLVRLCRLEELPLTVLARVGYRTTGAAADVDGTDEAINGLGKCLADVLGLEFDSQKACGARRSKGWKGAPPSQLVPGYI
ncbi:unnamed protein product [Pylaiella littoralis]